MIQLYKVWVVNDIWYLVSSLVWEKSKRCALKNTDENTSVEGKKI